MYAFESAVHETCRADLGKWSVVPAPYPAPRWLLKITRVGPGTGPNRDVAVVTATTDLRVADTEEGFEDETGRANAYLLADAPALLSALAQLLDACYLRGTRHPERGEVFLTAVKRAVQLLESHSDAGRAVQWWIQAHLEGGQELARAVEQSREKGD